MTLIPSGKTRSTATVNIDLQNERKSATIDTEEFAQWWAGGEEPLRKRRALEKLFFDDPEFDDLVHISYLSHKKLYEHTIAKATKFLTKLRQWHNDSQSEVYKDAAASLYEYRRLLTGPLGAALFQQTLPLRLHFSMFMPTLLRQGNEEQLREWLQKAWDMQVIGTYAQTELGHGTFLRGLETRADYDVEREEFVLNTPTLTAYKWWPGGLGHTANVVVVMAQLYIKGKHCGLQSFLVRIRNEETHMPEPGVDVGEIGAKIGLNGVNNGFLGLKMVRIPRKQMLMKNAQVLADGTFIKGPEPLLTYGTMVYVRAVIVGDVSFNLLHAATIATRYSAVRRQSPIEPDQPEPQILDHVTQQAKIFPQIAKGIFFRLAADYVWSMYQVVSKELDAGNRRNLSELHALSCCLKAVCSEQSAAGVEILRKACGGQGYLASANFGQIYGAATAACTYEGENTVLLLQTARSLVKNYADGLKRKVLPKTMTYLREQGRLKWSTKQLVASAVRALEIAACEKTRIAFFYLRQKRNESGGRSEQMAANLAGLKLTQAASLHGKAFLAHMALDEVSKLKRLLSPAMAEVMQQLLEIFVYDIFLDSLADVVRFNTLRQQEISEVELRFEKVLFEFRRNAVAVVDGFDFHDRVLGSTLRCYDGCVYERLMEEAKKSPLNQEPVNQSFYTHLKPFMKGKL